MIAKEGTVHSRFSIIEENTYAAHCPKFSVIKTRGGLPPETLGTYHTRFAAERRLAALKDAAASKNGFARFLDGYISRTGRGQGQ